MDILLERVDGEPVVNIEQKIVRHSPTGFEWGYVGSGPADLSLNILREFLSEHDADKYYNRFMHEIIANVPHDGAIILHNIIILWIEKQKQREQDTIEVA